MTNKVLSKQEATAIASYKYGDTALDAYRNAFPQAKKWKEATVKAKAKRLFDSVGVTQGNNPETVTTEESSAVTPKKKPTSKRKTPKVTKNKAKSPDKQTKLPPHELSDEQKELYNACTKLQRRVVIFITQGNMSQRKAYYAAGGAAKTETTADTSVSEILSNPKVKAFYDSLTATEILGAVMSRNEMREELSKIARWDLPALLKLNKEQTEEFNKEQYTDEKMKLRMQAQPKAMQQLSKLDGYDSATQFEVFTPKGKSRHITDDMTQEEASQIYKESLKRPKEE